MPRHYRRQAMRSRAPRPIINSFKKVINIAPTSQSSGSTIITTMSLGEDSIAGGQTSAIDPGVPTGSIIKYFEIQYACMNLVQISLYMHIAIQHLRATQLKVTPNVVGGNPQRNQVFYQKLHVMGQSQNNNFTFRFKIPKKYQRVREGDTWLFTRIADQVYSDCVQIIYKFYR